MEDEAQDRKRSSRREQASTRSGGAVNNMKDMFLEVVQFRHLLYMLAWRDIKIRYKQTVMGFLWAIFMPALIVLSGLIVRKAMSVLSGKPVEMSELVSVM